MDVLIMVAGPQSIFAVDRKFKISGYSQLWGLSCLVSRVLVKGPQILGFDGLRYPIDIRP